MIAISIPVLSFAEPVKNTSTHTTSMHEKNTTPSSSLALTVYSEPSKHTKPLVVLDKPQGFEYSNSDMLKIKLNDGTMGWVNRVELNSYINMLYKSGFYVSINGINGDYILTLKDKNQRLAEIDESMQAMENEFSTLFSLFNAPFEKNTHSQNHSNSPLHKRISQLEQKIHELEAQK